jgi:hypothetical protein
LLLYSLASLRHTPPRVFLTALLLATPPLLLPLAAL